MTTDNRDGRDPRTGNVEFTAAMAGTSSPLLAPRPEVSVSLSDIIASYDNAGTTEAKLELYDDDPTTSEGNLSTPFFVVHLSPGDTFDITGGDFKDIKAGLVAVVRNNDDEVAINANGIDITG